MSVMKELYYTEKHEWVRIEEDTAVVGISDYAQELLGEITYVELPEMGLEVESGEELAVVESSKAASDVYAPVSGEVTEVNDGLEASPELINEECYDSGWICKIKLSVPSEVDSLLSSDDYEKFLKTVD